MAARLAWLAALAGLQLVALVLAHDLTFLVRHGSRFGEALVHAGHGGTWSTAVATAILLGIALAALAAARLAWLGSLARRREGSTRPSPATRAAPAMRRFVGRWLLVGIPMAGLDVVALSLQENVERAAIGAPGLGAWILLTPEYAGGFWIALAVGLLVGLVAALYRWRVAVLCARLGAARGADTRIGAAPAPRTGLATIAPPGSLLGRRSALRAPPAAATF